MDSVKALQGEMHTACIHKLSLQTIRQDVCNLVMSQW